jgi:hypothetical protein
MQSFTRANALLVVRVPVVWIETGKGGHRSYSGLRRQPLDACLEAYSLRQAQSKEWHYVTQVFHSLRIEAGPPFVLAFYYRVLNQTPLSARRSG